MPVEDWKRNAAKGVVLQIRKSMEKEGILLECWKNYLKGVNKNMLELMKQIEPAFVEEVLSLL